MLADPGKWERRYYSPEHMMRLSCEERARLVSFGSRWAARRDEWMDRYVSARRVEFVRWLIAHGRLSEGVEDGGSA